MITAITALGRITQRQQEPLIATRQCLQALGTAGRILQGLAGDVRYALAIVDFGLHQPFFGQQPEHSRTGLQRGVRGDFRARVLTFGQQGEIQQAVGVVEGRPQQLTAGEVLERGRQATVELHVRGVDGQAGAEARQRGAIGAQQEDRFDQIARRLLDRQRSQLRVVQRPFAHDPCYRQRQLLTDLLDVEFSDAGVATTPAGQQAVSVIDGLFATLDRDVHQAHSCTRVLRGKPSSRLPETKNTSSPQGKTLRASRAAQKP